MFLLLATVQCFFVKFLKHSEAMRSCLFSTELSVYGDDFRYSCWLKHTHLQKNKNTGHHRASSSNHPLRNTLFSGGVKGRGWPRWEVFFSFSDVSLPSYLFGNLSDLCWLVHMEGVARFNKLLWILSETRYRCRQNVVCVAFLRLCSTSCHEDLIGLGKPWVLRHCSMVKTKILLLLYS